MAYAKCNTIHNIYWTAIQKFWVCVFLFLFLNNFYQHLFDAMIKCNTVKKLLQQFSI